MTHHFPATPTYHPPITLKKRKEIFHYFVTDTSAKKTALEHVFVSRPCVNDWYRKWREAIYAHTSPSPRLFGEVEVDIGFFSGNSGKKNSALVRRLAGLPEARIVAHRKQVAKDERKKQMILGFLQRGGRLYLHPIKSKSQRSLEAAILLVLEKGTIIYSDMEKGLANIKKKGYRHYPINHSVEYTNKKGHHINGIENVWMQLRSAMSRNFKGIPRSTLPLHIKEREARFNHRDDFEKWLKTIVTIGNNSAKKRTTKRRSSVPAPTSATPVSTPSISAD